MRSQLSFLLALWKANLLAAMEYRASFLTQIIGMILNDGVYFLFWVLFFDRFKEVRGWGISQMILLFGLVAAGFGVSTFLFGNILTLAEVIITGRLDYYLSLPRPVLLHVLASSSNASGLGDFIYGVISFLLLRQFAPGEVLRFFMGMLFSSCVFLSFLVFVQSLSFWMGSAQSLSGQVVMAIVTFSSYPSSLFGGTARFLLFTILPAGLIGAAPAAFALNFSWEVFAQLLAGATFFLVLALVTFQRGLRHYESGSAIAVRL